MMLTGRRSGRRCWTTNSEIMADKQADPTAAEVKSSSTETRTLEIAVTCDEPKDTAAIAALHWSPWINVKGDERKELIPALAAGKLTRERGGLGKGERIFVYVREPDKPEDIHFHVYKSRT